jgi:signal transduction histidine kinase
LGMGRKLAERGFNALIEAGISLASEHDLDTLLQLIANVSRDLIGAAYGAVGILGPEGELTRFVYSGIDAETARRIGSLPTGRGVLGAVIEEGRPLRLPEIEEHPRSFGFPDQHPEMHTFLGVPIVARGNVFGRLYLTEKHDGEGFTTDDERIAMMLAAQAGVAIESARLTEALRDLAVLEERERISKELHDGVIQAVYSVGLSLQGTISLVTVEPEMAVGRLNDAIRHLDEVVRDVRNYIFELRPSLLRERGLRDALEELAADLRVNTLATVELYLQEEACASLSSDQETHLLQILREVLSNVARHAEASEVSIRCIRGREGVVIEISDNGNGFGRDSVRAGDGLRNIQERIIRLGGELSILDRQPKGTLHRLHIPFPRSLDLR